MPALTNLLFLITIALPFNLLFFSLRFYIVLINDTIILNSKIAKKALPYDIPSLAHILFILSHKDENNAQHNQSCDN